MLLLLKWILLFLLILLLLKWLLIIILLIFISNTINIIICSKNNIIIDIFNIVINVTLINNNYNNIYDDNVDIA